MKSRINYAMIGLTIISLSVAVWDNWFSAILTCFGIGLYQLRPKVMEWL